MYQVNSINHSSKKLHRIPCDMSTHSSNNSMHVCTWSGMNIVISTAVAPVTSLPHKSLGGKVWNSSTSVHLDLTKLDPNYSPSRYDYLYMALNFFSCALAGLDAEICCGLTLLQILWWASGTKALESFKETEGIDIAS